MIKRILLSIIVSTLLIGADCWGSSDAPRLAPILTAGNITQAPIIDGNLKESCWKKAAGSVMLPIHDKDKQADRSRFLICYDNKNLYIGAELYQSYLNPVLNMVSRTNVKCTTRDGRLFGDDVFELFLMPTGNNEYYHLAFNMKAIVYDEKGTGLDNLTKKWNCPVKVAVKKKTTKWLIEIAIPLKALMVKKDLNGQSWKVNFCRWNAPKKESYAWSLFPGTFHNSKHFGKLFFSNSLPHLQCRTINTSRKVMTLTVRGGGNEKIVFKNCVSKAEIPADKWKQVQVKAVPAQQTGLTWISAMVGNKEIMRTPALYIDNKIFKAVALLKCPNTKLTLFANTRKIVTSSDVIKTNIPLTADKNAITLEVSGSGTALTGSISINGLIISSKQFLFSRTNPKDWKTIDFNDSKWELYNGQPIKGKAFFRYTFLKDYTIFAPQLNSNTFYFANNTAMLMRCRIGSPFTWALKNYVVIFKLPKGLNIPVYELAKRDYKKYFNTIYKKSIANGTEYRFVYDKSIPKLAYNFGQHVLNFVIQSKLKGSKTDTLKGEVFIQGRGVAEIPRTFKIQTLPELQGIQPKKNVVIAVLGRRGKVFSNNEMLYLIPTMKKAGFNQTYARYRTLPEDLKAVQDLRKAGIKSNFLYYGPEGRQITKEIWEKYPNKRFVNQHYPSKNWNYSLCPLAFMEDPIIKKNLVSRYKIFDAFCYDMEHGIKSTCMCERCRKLFAKKNKLNHVPSEDEIYNKYEKELIKFQVWMNKRVYESQVALAKTVNPKIKTSIYNAYDSKGNRKRYGIDWKLYKNIDYPTAGYVENTETIMKTRNAMGGRSMICGKLLSSDLYRNPYANQMIKAKMFYQLLNSGFGGVMLWTLMEVDGRGYTAIAEFTRGIATFENFFNEKNEISSKGLVKGISLNSVHLYRKDGLYVMLIINLRGTEQELTIKLPRDMTHAKIFDFYQNKTFTANKIFTTKIKARDAVIFKIIPKK